MDVQEKSPGHPKGWARAEAALSKVRRNGTPWFWRRLGEEWRQPTTPPGRAFKRAVVRGGGSVLMAASAVPRLMGSGRGHVTLFYDLEVSPITYDFAWALVGAEKLRRERGLDFIRVVVVPGRHGGLRHEEPAYEAVVDAEARKFRVQHIVLALCRALPSVHGVHLCSTRMEATVACALARGPVLPQGYWPAFPSAHDPADILRAPERSESVPLALRATEAALRQVRPWLAHVAGGRRPVTITLREYAFMPQRNSNIEAWIAFAERLDAAAYAPIFVRDTEAALGPIPERMARHVLMPEASWNLELRLALYELCYLNLMVNNGPHGLCMFNGAARYMMFKILTPSVPQTTEAYMRSLGFTIGAQPAFARPWHRWVWEDDSLDVIEREFARMCRDIDGAVASGALRAPVL